MNKALVVVDMVNDFVSPDGSLYVPNTANVIEPIKAKIKEAKEAGIPVIFVNDSHEEDDKEFAIWPKHCVKNTEGAKVVEALMISEGNTYVDKTTYSGFYETRLDKVLKEAGVEEVTLVGCVTNICILYTASDAVLRGYKVTVPKNCVAGLDDVVDLFVFKQMSDVLKVNVVE